MVDDRSPGLRPLRFRIAEITRALGKPQYVVEKDYALGYLLAGIVSVRELRDSLVFKGGTCLRKAYFPGYRFSEDLDFTSRRPLSCADLADSLRSAVDEARLRLSAHGPFSLSVAQETYREPHPRDQCAFRVSVQFPWMRAPMGSLKIEVSMQEPLVAGSIERPLIHEFPGETLVVTIPTYRLEEIAAEKLRAFLQSRQHLRDRGWLRNRPRDLYDLWHLRDQQDFSVNWAEVGGLLRAKAVAYSLAYDGPQDFLDVRVLQGIERDWRAQLASFVVDLPPFEQCLSVYRTIVGDVAG